MKCYKCGKKISNGELDVCPYCGAKIKDLLDDKTIAINMKDELSQDIYNETFEDEINKQIEEVNEEAKILNDVSSEKIVVDGSILQEESLLDDLSSDSSISKRKRTFFLSIGIALCVVVIIAGILLFIPKKEDHSNDYLKDVENIMNDAYHDGNTEKIQEILEYVADDDNKLNIVHEKSNDIVTVWVDTYKENEIDNSDAFQSEEIRLIGIVNKLYDYSVTNKNGDIVRLFAVNDYNALIKSIEKIYEDGRTYYEAINYYHSKDYNNAYYFFGRVEEDNLYYQKSKDYQKTIVSDILSILNKDIQKIEINNDNLSNEELLKQSAQVIDIIIGYDSVYENVSLKDNDTYQSLLKEYNDKVSYYTEQIQLENNSPEESVEDTPVIPEED